MDSVTSIRIQDLLPPQIMEIQQPIRTSIQGQDCPGNDIVGRAVAVDIGGEHAQTKRRVIRMTHRSRTEWKAVVKTASDRSGEQVTIWN